LFLSHARRQPLYQPHLSAPTGSGLPQEKRKAANDTFDARPVPTLPPTKLPLDFTPERIPILLTDTSAKPEDTRALEAVIRESDAVVVCFDPRKPATLESVRTSWYPRVQAVNPDIPIILACCKADRLSDRDPQTVRERVERVARDLPNVECCLNCSSKYNKMVHDVFYHALKAVLYPLQPLYDRTDRVIRQAAIRALKRIFIIFDADKDGTLSDAEVNAFQSMCFGISLSAEELRGIKQVVRQQVPNGYTDTGLTLEGFLFLQARGLFIERGRLETVWQVLRRFGYNDQLRLSDELLDRVNVHLPPDQVLELSDIAVTFLRQQFTLYDARDEGMLSWEQLQGLFSTAPSLPTEWQNERVNRLMVCGTYGAVHNMDAFIARWRYCALTDPRATLAHLLYLGYEGSPGDLLVRRQRRRPDKRHREELVERTTALCYVLGTGGCGKSTLLRALAGRRAEGDQAGGGPGGSGAAAAAGGAPSLTALATVTCDDGRDRTLALVEEQPPPPPPQQQRACYRPSLSLPTPQPPLLPPPAPRVRQFPRPPPPPSLLQQQRQPPGLPSSHRRRRRPPVLVPAQRRRRRRRRLRRAFSPRLLLVPELCIACRIWPVAIVRCFCLTAPARTLGPGRTGPCLRCVDYRGSCETLPVLLVATKDDVGMNGELRERVLAASGELSLPDPLPVAAADMAAMGGVFRQILSASFLAPEAHIPDTPVRKDRRRLQRRLVVGGVALTAAALGGYCLYTMYMGGTASGTEASSGGKAGAGGSGGGGSAAASGPPVVVGAGTAASSGTASVVAAEGAALPEGSSLAERLSSLFSMSGASFTAR
ncbi:hypothetical protein VOLCADRAFT_118238, partial [Volvox carteri f. nagariensis]